MEAVYDIKEGFLIKKNDFESLALLIFSTNFRQRCELCLVAFRETLEYFLNSVTLIFLIIFVFGEIYIHVSVLFVLWG